MAYTKFRYNIKSNKQWTSLEKRVKESYNKFGIDCIFCPKAYLSESLSSGDYLDSVYNEGKEMILRPDTGMVSEFGSNSIFSKFGYTNTNTLNFFATISQFTDIEENPKEGDLIYIVDMMNKKLMEIVNVTYESENNKYPFGEPMVFILETKIHNPDLIADYNTGDVNIDSLDDTAQEFEDQMEEKIDDKVADHNIVDTTETNPLNQN